MQNAIAAIKWGTSLVVKAAPLGVEFDSHCHFLACKNGTSSTYGGKKSKSTPYPGGASSTDECYKCGRKGHWSSSACALASFLLRLMAKYYSSDCQEGSSNFSKRSYSSNSSGTAKRGRGGTKSRDTRGKKKSAFAAADDW